VEGRVVSGAVRGTAGHMGYYCTAIGRSDRLFYYHYYYYYYYHYYYYY
jgi:hypothetical protein